MLLGVLDAGAYGFVMSSSYNQRPRAAEVLITSDGTPKLIRRRETVEDLAKFFVERVGDRNWRAEALEKVSPPAPNLPTPSKIFVRVDGGTGCASSASTADVSRIRLRKLFSGVLRFFKRFSHSK